LLISDGDLHKHFAAVDDDDENDDYDLMMMTLDNYDRE
jgi:hypothetical protein